MKLLLKELLGREIASLGAPNRALHCTPTTSVENAVLTLRREKVGSLVIVEDKKVKGIFTERDFLEKVALKGVDMSSVKVESYMTSNPVCVKRHEPIGDALNKMRIGKFRHVIIVDGYGHLEKVVSIREIMDYLMTPITQQMNQAA